MTDRYNIQPSTSTLKEPEDSLQTIRDPRRIAPALAQSSRKYEGGNPSAFQHHSSSSRPAIAIPNAAPASPLQVVRLTVRKEEFLGSPKAKSTLSHKRQRPNPVLTGAVYVDAALKPASRFCQVHGDPGYQGGPRQGSGLTTLPDLPG